MKRTTPKYSLIVCALLGLLSGGQAMAADIRYMNSGDYLDPAGWQGGAIPGTNDTARFNWGNNTVTLAGEAPLLRRFQAGVDESGQLVIESGGKLVTTGGANSTVGNNGGLAVVGRLTVNQGGEAIVTNVLFVGASATGVLTINGGTVTVTSHLWSGTTATGVGYTYVTNGGVLNVGGNIGLGTINASTPSTGKGFLYVQDGTLNLTVIDGAGNSIQPNSVLDISGTGKVTIPGDMVGVMSAYTNAGKIIAYGGIGSVAIDYNNTTPGKTTLTAIAGEVPPTDVVWNPAANPTGTGKWNESANWTGSVRPVSITKVTFNVPGAIPCTITNPSVANYVIMGDNGPGGTLIVTNGGGLTTGSENASVIGYNSNGTMIVEADAAVSFGFQLWVGLDPGSDGTLIMNGGTVTVANMFGIGWQGGKGTVRVKGGTLNLNQWDDALSIQGNSLLDVSGTGSVVINGNHQDAINGYVSLGQIKANGGADTVAVDYNHIHLGKTTVYPASAYVAPEQVVWDPSLNVGDTRGLWNVSSNWTGGIGPSNVTTVLFNVTDAIPAIVNKAASARAVRMGINGGPGGTLIVTNGGSLSVSDADWSAVGYNNTATMIVENGGTVSFGNHLWVGFEAAADGTFIMNGGTVSVGQMFGLGWNGGKGTAQINGGTLNLSQLHATDSIKGESKLNIAGTAKVVITGDQVTAISNYVAAGKITANGGPNVFYGFDAGANKTTVSAVPLAVPQQSITAVTVSGGNVSITYQTTAQHTYYLESTPSLSPASWTPITGSTNAATGAPVTFTTPASGTQMFYRTVSP